VAHEIGLHPHPVYNWLGGSPDGITESGKLLEIKCPMMRAIKDEVPIHYMPQLQLLMEILDLETCDFIQYKPDELTWPEPAQFQVTHVVRDRQWFAEKLPIMDAFWKRVLYHRQHGVESLIKAPRAKRAKKVPLVSACRIVELEEDQEESDIEEEEHYSESQLWEDSYL
jgi:hypothetical protein